MGGLGVDVEVGGCVRVEVVVVVISFAAVNFLERKRVVARR